MAQLLTYADVDQQIQDEMSGQAPSSTNIIRAVDAEVRNLLTKYNIEAFLRTLSISVTTDGKTAYKISTLVADNDVDTIHGIFESDDNRVYTSVSLEKILNDSAIGLAADQYCLYYEEGEMYLRVMSTDLSATAVTLTLKYYTTARALDDSGEFITKIVGGTDEKILLPEKYLDLVMLGAMKRLFYQALGDSDTAQVNIIRNRYESELSKLGLSSNAKTVSRDSRRVKLHVQW